MLVGLCFVVFWGTYFPLISEAVTGQQASVGAPWFDRYTVPLALILVLLSGVGPVIAWRRASLANMRSNLLAPTACGVIALLALLGANVSGKPLALVMFCFAAFVIGAVAQELWRGGRVRSRAAGEMLLVAIAGLVKRNRRRYGGYIVHVGVAVLFVGVAASSSFERLSEPTLEVGRSVKVGDYTVRYVKPTASVTPASDSAHTGSTLNLGAVLRVSREGHYVTTLRPTEGFYDSGEPTQGSVGHLIGGQAVSHVALSSTISRDVWAAVEPDISAPSLQKIVEAGNKTIPIVRPEEGMIAIAVLAREYLKSPPPAKFNFRVFPFVTWIWIGAMIVFGGGLIAMWPTPSTVVRRVSVRVGRRRRASRDLARA